MLSDYKELEIEISGRVQAIGFRRTVSKYANKNGINGYVLNRENGSVFITAQGSENKLKKFLVWLNSSPGLSKVKELNYIWKNALDLHKEFKILHTSSFLKEQTHNFLNLGKYLFSSKGKIPNHVAIIPDGNRRWAKAKGLESQAGHYKAGSIANVRSLLSFASKFGVKYLSLWGFSTENWKRGDRELKSLFTLLIDACNSLESDAISKHYRFVHIGRKDRLPEKLIKAISKLEKITANNTGMNVCLCLDYGGREELVMAVNKLIKSGKKKINESDLNQNLYTAGIPDVDLIIRTSGEQRTSGFMPFQSIYAELYFTEKHFPDFTTKDLQKALIWYSHRDRRFGGK